MRYSFRCFAQSFNFIPLHFAMKRQIAPIFLKSKKSKSNVSVGEDAGPREYKIISWNVAGARAWVKNVFDDYHVTNCASKVKGGGYAGVALLSKTKPMKTEKGIGDDRFDSEGRLIVAEFFSFYFVGAYVPNSGRGLVNLEKRGVWEELMRVKLNSLNQQKPVIYAGDLNVAYEEIDLANPKSNANKTAGFTDQEREDFGKMLQEGFVDTFRQLHPSRVGYTFWSFMGGARAKNVGWRLDYFVISERIMKDVKESEIMADVMGSDHAPIRLVVSL